MLKPNDFPPEQESTLKALCTILGFFCLDFAQQAASGVDVDDAIITHERANTCFNILVKELTDQLQATPDEVMQLGSRLAPDLHAFEQIAHIMRDAMPPTMRDDDEQPPDGAMSDQTLDDILHDFGRDDPPTPPGNWSPPSFDSPWSGPDLGLS